MKEVVKGCLWISVIGIIILLAMKLIFGELFELMFMPLLLFSPLLAMIIIGAVANLISESIKAGKWLGLGAIAGNTINNKINADAAIKSGKRFQKSKIKTKNSLFQSVINFVSPPTDEGIPEPITDKDYQEFQEFLEWKKLNAQKSEIDNKDLK